ncbi:MAG: response regulator transcription factor [bacterium]|nr:response regulator transcription factor [bacterium]
MTRILVVENDRAILSGLERNLRFEGYEVMTATDGEQGLRLAQEKAPDLIILDIMLPRSNGYEVCRVLRRGGTDIPILMLTAKGQEMDKVMGLEVGADDYMTKPFGVMELLARVKALLRRVQRVEGQVERLSLGEVRVDFETFTVQRGDESVELSTREFGVLRYLAKNQGRVLSRQDILNAVWGVDYFGTDRTVDNFITRLRQKIEPVPGQPCYIQTVRGMGYRFVVED